MVGYHFNAGVSRTRPVSKTVTLGKSEGFPHTHTQKKRKKKEKKLEWFSSPFVFCFSFRDFFAFCVLKSLSFFFLLPIFTLFCPTVLLIKACISLRFPLLVFFFFLNFVVSCFQFRSSFAGKRLFPFLDSIVHRSRKKKDPFFVRKFFFSIPPLVFCFSLFRWFRND